MNRVEETQAAETQAILFDIDGTLISSGGAGGRSWDWAFRQVCGTPADVGRFSEAGTTDPQVARQTFAGLLGRRPTPRELGRLMAAYLQRLPEEVATSAHYRVLEGVAELLPRLCSAGYLLGLTTGNLEAAAHIKLSRGGLNWAFCFGGYGSDADDRAGLTRLAIKRAGRVLGEPVDPRGVLVVGDTPRDVQAALAAGAVPVAVASGGYGADELRRAGAVHVLGSLREPLPGLDDLDAAA